MTKASQVRRKSLCFTSLIVVISSVVILKLVCFPQQILPPKFMKRGQLVGHNGAGEGYPEDTIEALDVAIHKYLCDIVEVDVRVTKDDRLVCIHDTTVDRTTNGTGLVSDLTLSQIQNLDASRRWPNFHNKGVKIPSLDEAIEWLSRQNSEVLMLIEIKPLANWNTVVQVQKMYEKYPMLYERAIVMSFEPHVLMAIRLLDEKIGTAIISFAGLVSSGCQHKILPPTFCSFLTDFKLLNSVDWFSLVLGKHIIPWVVGSGGIVINANCTSPTEVKQFMDSNLWVDVWGIKDHKLTVEYHKLGAAVAPDVLKKINLDV